MWVKKQRLQVRMNVTNVMQCLNMCHEHTSMSSQIARHDQPYDKHLKWYQEWTVAWMNHIFIMKIDCQNTEYTCMVKEMYQAGTF